MSDKAIVLYDGDCPLCRKTTGILKRLDWLHLLRFHNCRDSAGIPANTAHLEPARMIAEMHVLAADRKTAFPDSGPCAGLPAVCRSCGRSIRCCSFLACRDWVNEFTSGSPGIAFISCHVTTVSVPFPRGAGKA